MTNYVKNLMEAAGVKPETVTDYELNEYHIYPCLYARKAASRLLKAEKYI